MVIAKAFSHILLVKSSSHLPANNPHQVGFTHPQSSSGSSDSGRSKAEACTDSDAGDTQVDLVQIPAKCDRVNGRKYLHRGNVCMWRNGVICCEHGRQKRQCKECGGSGICEHGRQKYRCKECGGRTVISGAGTRWKC
eukprot:GSChrysophyteH2.ASY1.ANO1.788.1 assembled CDS